MAEQFQNFFVTKLREACDATATTIYVDTVPAITEGTLVLEYANSTKHEIIHFTGVSGYGLTGCTRGLEGTTAQSHSAGTDVRQNLTAGMIDKIINGVITTENIANSAVTTAKINNGAVTADKIDFTTLGGNYSTTEVDTGFTFIDGKKIYKKTINFGALPNSTDKQVAHGISNLYQMVGMSGVAIHPNKTTLPLPFVGSTSLTAGVALNTNDTYVIVTAASDRTAFNKSYITIYYTKTS
jgi:hypothetical protein